MYCNAYCFRWVLDYLCTRICPYIVLHVHCTWMYAHWIQVLAYRKHHKWKLSDDLVLDELSQLHYVLSFFRMFQVFLGNGHHLGADRTFVCPMCGKQLQSSATLQRHIDIHRGVYPYQCTVCRRGFSHTQNLQDHMRHHTGERFTCEKCNRKFISKRGYQDHKHFCSEPLEPSTSPHGMVKLKWSKHLQIKIPVVHQSTSIADHYL